MLHATCAISIDIDQFTADTELLEAIRASSWAFPCFFAELALCGQKALTNSSRVPQEQRVLILAIKSLGLDSSNLSGSPL
jgi:hypothetical protein